MNKSKTIDNSNRISPLEISMSTYPHILQGLTTREAIIDALYRAVNSYDTYDIALHDSAYFPSPEVTFTFGDRGTYTGLEEIRGILRNVGPLGTTHLVSNPRVQIKEDGKSAVLTATTIAQHCRPGNGGSPDVQKFMTGSLYDMDVVLDEKDGLWKILHFRMKVVWTEGDASVMQSASE